MRPMDPVSAGILADTLIGMVPWSRLGSTVTGLAQSMTDNPAHGVRSWCLTVDGAIAGVLVVHEAWLCGPYLKRLAVLPPFQRQGLAQAAIAWWEADARQARASNLWLCVSDFNHAARQFYEAAGFRQAGVLDDLVVDGLNEILMRKRLTAPILP